MKRKRIWIAILLLASLLLSTQTSLGDGTGTYTPPVPVGYFSFDAITKRLTINTTRLKLIIEQGAIVHIKDNASNEILLDTNASINFPTSPQFPVAGDGRGFVGFTSRIDVTQSECYRRPGRAVDNAVTYTQISQTQARLVYSPLFIDFWHPDGCSLTYNFTVDETSGEILVQLTGVETQYGWKPSSIDLPIMNFRGASVITGTSKILRAGSAAVTRSSTGGTSSPNVAVAEGSSSCLAAWPENGNTFEEYAKILHYPSYDHMVMHTGVNPLQTQSAPKTMISSTWRVGTYVNWVEAARRWRTLFELQTPAKPLWQNRAAWVRNIHAVHTQGHYTDQSKYNKLASLVTPSKLLYFIWNGDRIVLFGDPTLTAGTDTVIPYPAEIAAIKSYGWNLCLYHPWNLFYGSAGAAARLAKVASMGWLPAGYTFTPDCATTAANWLTYWSDVDAAYDNAGEGLREVHPGAAKFQDYISRNYGNYCAAHSASGCYLDILGSDESFKFASGRQIINGQTYKTGTKNAIARLNTDLPNLAVMSENIPTWLVPYVWYTWEAYYHTTNGNDKMNHPLRTALMGSYTWTLEQGPLDMSTALSDEQSALLGALPTLSLAGDVGISDVLAAWRQSKAALFCTYDLFNDLPPRWDSTALAYYRSNNGHWFKFKKFGPGQYAYVEETIGGDLIHLANF